MKVSSYHAMQGITLVELMTTTAIASILLGITISSMSDYLQTSRRDGFLTELKTALNYARIYAAHNKQNVSLCPFKNDQCIVDWQQDIVVFVDAPPFGSYQSGETILRVVERQHQDIITYPRRAITFKPSGGLNMLNSGSFVYCVQGSSAIKGMRITLSQAGRIRLRDYEGC